MRTTIHFGQTFVSLYRRVIKLLADALQSNSRFEAAKSAVLRSLPEDAPPEYREEALSEFYRQWLTQERDHLREYSEEWNRRNFEDIKLSARIALHRLRSRFFGLATR